MFKPGAPAQIRARAVGFRPMPRQVGSTTVAPSGRNELLQFRNRNGLIIECAVVKRHEGIHA